MSVKNTVLKQYQRLVNTAAERLANIAKPNEGWIVTYRKALGMSGADLAHRMGITKTAIYQAQRNELTGAITLSQMDKMAQAMGGKLVYAIVPQSGDVESTIMEQARKKATRRVRNVRTHMALEDQSGGLEPVEITIERKAKELAEKQPQGFWK